jgi:hypothetical protein
MFLKSLGMQPRVINDALIKAAKQTGREHTWVYKDVYDSFAPTKEERAQDASNFVTWMQERKDKTGTDAPWSLCVAAYTSLSDDSISDIP